MKEVFTREWCDRHRLLLGDATVPATVVVRIALDDADPVDIDSCEPCDVEFWQPLRELVASGRMTEENAHSRRPTAARRNGGTKKGLADYARWTCRLCPAGPYTNPKSLMDHIWKVHVGIARPTQPGQCPDCEYNNTHGPGMSRHRSHRHGYDALAEAYAEVEKLRTTPPKGARRARTT